MKDFCGYLHFTDEKFEIRELKKWADDHISCYWLNQQFWWLILTQFWLRAEADSEQEPTIKSEVLNFELSIQLNQQMKGMDKRSVKN